MPAHSSGQSLLERLELRLLFSASYMINGVQADALDQPQIHGLFRQTATGQPITATDPDTGDTSFDVQGYLDTGTSSILLSQETSQGLGLASSTFAGKPVAFTDIGIGGGETFDVSQPLYGSLANFSPAIDGTDASTFKQNFGPVRTEINQQPADPDLGDPIDIFGMPALQGKVAVFDPGPINSLNNMNSYLYSPGTPYRPASAGTDPGIPATNLHVKLSYGSFSNFTSTSPSGAPGPTLADNPFIGPNPVALLSGHNDGTPPVTISSGGHAGTGSFLFDTGAATSFISTAMAAKVGVHYKAGTQDTANPVLVDASGKLIPNQFTEPLGGIGGSTTAAGFFLDSLTLPTVEGTPIVFTHAPVAVIDITAQNPTTGQTLTLDGDFGMNYLVTITDASLSVDHTGDFKWVTYDQPKGILGLDLPNVKPVSVGSISGTVFNDSKADGVHQSTEPGAKGFTLTLHNLADANPNTIDATATSDASGNYHFANLKAGNFILAVAGLPGWRPTGATAIRQSLTLGQDVSAKNFFQTQKARLSGAVFYDKNSNGKMDVGEALAGWRVYIQTTAATGYVSTDSSSITDKSGNWIFNDLAAGKYTIRVVQMSGYKLSSPVGGAFVLSVTSGQVLTSKSFIEKHA